MQQATAAELAASGGLMNPVDDEGLCLLSLDGGGARGLSTLFILKCIMERLNSERKKASRDPAKPCETFDLMEAPVLEGKGTGSLGDWWVLTC
jgi:patatin-like phospholipase/acyl hydrolase